MPVRYAATIVWERSGAPFTDLRYSRGHRWLFDGGVEVPGSSSPHSVPVPMSVAAAVDPEEAFVASVSSCHMLWFLALAAKEGRVMDSYRDEAWALLGPGPDGRIAIQEVHLRPRIVFGDGDPGPEGLARLHHAAHEECFIANSIRGVVQVE
jgi:organic hydroperoxide reductase OsmC/OhrA